MDQTLDFNGILSQLLRTGPTEEERRAASAQALSKAGLGILAANRASRFQQGPFPAIGEGGLMGLDAYQQSLDRQGAERKSNAAGALTALQIKKQLEQKDVLRGLLSPGGGVGGDTAAPPGGVSSMSADALGAPWAARPPQPQGATPAGGAGYQPIPLDRLARAAVGGVNIDPFLKLNEQARPKGENIRGVGLVNPYNGQTIAPFPYITESGRGAMSVPNGRGGFRIDVPEGSVYAYSNFQNADEAAKARFDPVTLQPTSPTQSPRIVSRASLFSGPAAPGAPAGAGGQGGIPSGMSPATAAAQAADTAQGTEIAKNYGDIYNKLQNASMANGGKIAKFQRVGTLLGDFEGGKLSKTGFELSRLGNSLGIKLDPNLSNKEAAESLSNEVALGLRSTADGAGMPGAMSDADREYLKQMTPQMSQTAQGRKLIIDSHVKVLERENQVAKMARAYKQKYGKMDENFFSQLSDWSTRNPLFQQPQQ